MPKIKIKYKSGLTLVELMMAMLVSVIVVWGAAMLMADSLSSWRTTYLRLHSNEADNTYAVQKRFEHLIRRASMSAGIAVTNSTVKVYYASTSSSGVNSHADFSYNSGAKQLTVTTTTPAGTTTEAIVPNVTSCAFKQSGNAVQMMLTLQYDASTDTLHPASKAKQTFTVVSTAYLNSN